MSEIAAAIQHIRAVADRVGLPELARKSGVPLTTLRSFRDRNWSHKSVEVVERLSAAAKKIDASPGEAA